jgi:hypothetical protein
MIKHRVESFAKYAGIATVSTEWLALLLYYIQMPAYFGGKYPISYFATLPQTRPIFNICYTLAGLFFWIFIRHHLHKFYRAPIKIFGLSMILFVGLAVTPFNPDNHLSNLIHSTLGWSSSLFFTVGMYLLARNANNKSVYRATMIAIIVSLVLIVAFANVSKDSHLIFAFESGSWLVWQIWVLWISYYSYKNHLLKK